MRRALLDLLLPARCAACGRPGDGLCEPCRRAAGALALPDGAPRRLGPGIVALAAFRYDGVVADAVRSVKAPGRHAPAAGLGRLLWGVAAGPAGSAVAWPRTWVPSTRARRRVRGADVPRLLAGPRSVALLRRRHHAHDQTELTAAQRRVAPRGAFVAAAPVPAAVVLVDDVRTTGATATAAAAALRAGGADRVLVVTLAVAGGAPPRRATRFPDLGDSSSS